MISELSETPEQVNQEAIELLAFATFGFNPEEVVTLYGSLQAYNQLLSQKDELDQSQRVLDLMRKIRGSAVEASRILKQGGQV